MSSARYHTFWRRFWAGILDGLIFLPFDWVDAKVQSINLPSSLLSLWLLVSYLAFSIYVVLMHARRGQTVGKMLTGVTVLSNRGEVPISFRQAVIRESPYIVLLLIGWAIVTANLLTSGDLNIPWWVYNLLTFAAFIWFALELITMLFNDKRRALHDHIAGTVVVRDA